MKTSLVSREVIAGSVELVARGHLFDGLVTISGCDKTVPAMAMALGRVNTPGLMLYSGSIQAGHCTIGGGQFTANHCDGVRDAGHFGAGLERDPGNRSGQEQGGSRLRAAGRP